METDQTIVALASGVGGAISVIRISGNDVFAICDKIFRGVGGKRLDKQKGYTLHFGEIVDVYGDQSVIDQVVVSVFRAPRSFTGENMIEISCHGSSYVRNKIIQLLIDSGARNAEAGEFTVRAFLNGKMDLSQAEAVADIIASDNKATHAMAMQQIKGGYSNEFAKLREQLIELVALLELELDFGEEDVEFADRTKLSHLLALIEVRINELLNSYTLGNSLKEGVPVAIVGKPNVGKSTLLNALVGEDRAMVSDIEGTTRDSIEEVINISGVRFRFIDTAGIRETSDKLEQMGIERTFASVEKAGVVMLIVDVTSPCEVDGDFLQGVSLREDQHLCVVLNKSDKLDSEAVQAFEVRVKSLLSDVCEFSSDCEILTISAKQKQGIDGLKTFLSESVNLAPLYSGDTIISNSRHYHALQRAKESLERAHTAMTSDLPADLLSQDIKETLHYLGLITGEITTDDVLGSIFSKFCIGK